MRRRTAEPGRQLEVERRDTLIYKGMEIDVAVLDAIVRPSHRVLWAFIERDGLIQPVPYDEAHVIWMTPDDVAQPDEIEI